MKALAPPVLPGSSPDTDAVSLRHVERAFQQLSPLTTEERTSNISKIYDMNNLREIKLLNSL